MKKAILFDLDGTLLNTSYDIYVSVNETLTAFQLPTISLEDTVKFVGNGAKNLMKRAVGDATCDFDAVFNDYVKRFAKSKNAHTVLYDGAHEFLTEAKRRNIKMAIITNKPHDATLNVYHTCLKDYKFDLILGMSQKFPLKPDPTSTIYAMQQLGVKKDECIFIGDGETDYLTASNAKIDYVSALWGYRSKDVLQSFGAKNFAENFTELKNLLFS